MMNIQLQADPSNSVYDFYIGNLDFYIFSNFEIRYSKLTMRRMKLTFK